MSESYVYQCNILSLQMCHSVVCFCPAEPINEVFLFYGKGRPGVIRGLDLNNKSRVQPMPPIEGLVNPRAIDFHAETRQIYFADTTSFLIGRQRLDGSRRETILKDGPLFYVYLHVASNISELQTNGPAFREF